LYVQAFSFNIKKIVKIKENFSSLSSKKIKELYKVINEPRKEKPRINMTSKGFLRRQVLVSMSLSNSTKFMVLSYKHVENINRALKNIKFNIMTDFIWADYQSLTIMTSKVTLSSDLSTIEKVYQEYRCY